VYEGKIPEPDILMRINHTVTPSGQPQFSFTRSHVPYISYHKLLINSLRSSVEQSTTRETNSHSASQQISGLLWIPKVHCRVHKRPPFVPTLIQLCPVHTHPLSLRFIQIIYSHIRARLPSGLFPSGFPIKIVY
jgi:hypothetical protein